MPLTLALARRYSPPPKDAYVVAKRCPNDQPSSWQETYIESKEKARVSCCKTGEDKGFRKVDGKCAGDLNYKDAVAFCATGGMLTLVSICIYIHATNQQSSQFCVYFLGRWTPMYS